MEFKPSSKRMDFFSIDKYSKKVEENCKIVYTVYDTYFYNEFKRKRDTINGYDFIEVSWAKNCQKTNLIIFIIAWVSSIKFFFYIFPVYFYILERSTVKTNIVHWSNQVYNTIEELITGKNIQTFEHTFSPIIHEWRVCINLSKLHISRSRNCVTTVPLSRKQERWDLFASVTVPSMEQGGETRRNLGGVTVVTVVKRRPVHGIPI